MNRQRFDVRAGIDSLKNKVTRPAAPKGAPKPKPKGSPGQKGTMRQGYSIPILRQTVIAVVICCLILVGTGIGLLTVAQSEIFALKSDLKAYTADGVVSASAADSAISLSIEAVGARITTMEAALTAATDSTMSSSDLQWFASELTAVKQEAQTLSSILDEANVSSDVKNEYAEKIHDPLVTVEAGYAEVSVSEADVASTNVGNDGAATDTGAFTSATGVGSVLKWIGIVLVILVILAVLAFLFRRRLGTVFQSLLAKIGVKPKRKGKQEQRAVAHQKGRPDRRTGTEPEPAPASVPGQPEPTGEAPSKPGFAFEEMPATPEEAPAKASDNEDPLDKLAPSFRKLAELERAVAEAETSAPAASKKLTTAVSEEDLMNFNENVTQQGEIDESEDDLFSKGDKA